MSTAAEPLIFPCPVVIDTREKQPFAFTGLLSDARYGRRPVVVRTITDTLQSADYSLLGMEAEIGIERKSLQDLFNTLGQGRKRFQRELDRLSLYQFAAVVCEADWQTITTAPPERSQLAPKIVFRSVIAWQIRFPRVHWWMCPGRDFAEKTTFRLLERYWKERQRSRPE